MPARCKDTPPKTSYTAFYYIFHHWVIVVAINMFRFKSGNCLSVLEIVKKELE